MELYEFDVADLRAGAPCYGDTVTGGHVGIGGFEVDPAQAAGRQQDRARENRMAFPGLFVIQQRRRAPPSSTTKSVMAA